MNRVEKTKDGQDAFVDYGRYSRKMLVGTKTIVNFINANLMETPIHYITFIRNYRPRLRRAGVLRQDRVSRRDVAVPFLLAKYWEESLLGGTGDRPPSEAAREAANAGDDGGLGKEE